MNFLNALERIPKLVEQYKAQNVTYERDIPILQETVGGTWKKEEELKALKAEVAALERKIQLMLAPTQTEVTEIHRQKNNDMSNNSVASPTITDKHLVNETSTSMNENKRANIGLRM